MKKKVKSLIVTFLVAFITFSAMIAFGAHLYLQREHTQKMADNEEKNIESLEKNESAEEVFKLTERVNILVMGLDTAEQSKQGSMRTDTLMFFSHDPKTGKSFILSIPRDSRVNIPGIGLDKINHAYANGGEDLTIQTVSEFIGLPIHHYIKVDYQAVIELVDAVGGVEVDVPQDMNYAVLGIHFKKGVQTLNGEDAVKYMRFRSGYAIPDIGRIGAQQQFLKLLLRKILSPAQIINLPKYVDIVNRNVETDLSKKQMLDYAMAILPEFNVATLKTAHIPGYGETINGVSYWIVNEAGKEELLAELMADPPPKAAEPPQG